MSCVATREHFSAYAEGHLTAAKADLLRSHMATCEICGPAFARFARGLDALSVERQAPAPAPLGDHMLAVLGLPPRERTAGWRAAWRAIPAWGRVAAAVVAIGTLGWGATAAAPGLARSLAAGVLGVEQRADGTWWTADPAARTALARELGASHPDVLAADPSVQRAALSALGHVLVDGRWVSPAEREAASQHAAGRVMVDGRWVSVAEIERAAREQAGLVLRDGRWVAPESIEDDARRAAGLIWFDGAWRQRAEVEAALLRAQGFTRDGDRWASDRERDLAAAVAAERKRASDLAIALEVARQLAQAQPLSAGGPTATVDASSTSRPQVSAPPGANPVLARMLDGVELLAGVQLADAIVIPLARPGTAATGDANGPTLVPATAAMAGGKVHVDNRDKVRLRNDGPHPVLIVAGEILTGGKQDRLIKRDVVVEAGGKVELDVFCAEKDRSTARGNVFDFEPLDAHASTTLRRMIVSGASQEAVWEGIATHHREANLHSPTKALQVTYTHPTARSRREGGVATLQGAIQARTDVVGIAVLRGGQIETLDIYPDPAFFRSQLGAIVAGIMLHDRRPGSADDAAMRVAEARVLGALEAAVALRPAAAATMDLDVRSQGLAGYVTAWKDQGVHLCLVTPLRPVVRGGNAGGSPGSGTPGGTSRRNPANPSGNGAPADAPAPGAQPNPNELERRGRLTPAEQRLLDRARARRDADRRAGERR